jgi:hypothetical protein
MTWTSAEVKKLMDEVLKELAPLAKKHNVNVKQGGTARYTDVSLTIPITLELTDTSGEPLQAKSDWSVYSFMYGLPIDALGKSFVDGGHQFTITGIAPKSRRFPVLVKRADGKTFKYPADRIMLYLKAEAK